jgi:hypothetical protein
LEFRVEDTKCAAQTDDVHEHTHQKSDP